MATTQELLSKFKSNLTAIYNKLEEKGIQVEGNKNLDNLVLVMDNVGSGAGGDIDALIDGSITEIESGVESVAPYAFYQRKSLLSAKFPNATNIGKNAFEECSIIENVEAPLVTTLGSQAFYSCKKLKNANFPLVKNIVMCFSNCVALESANFPALENVRSTSFAYCSNLKNIYAPLVTILGTQAFYGCSSLTSVNFPLVTKIDSQGFYNCNGLTSVRFPLVTSIGSEAFRCRSLTSVLFPKVTSIGNMCFYDAYNLKKVIIGTETDTICTLNNTNAFGTCYHILGTTNTTYNPDGLKDGYIYVPNALVADYRVATNWSTYASQIMPWVATTEELANIDTTLYDKACVGYENDGTEYSYDGTQWTEVIR